MAVWAFIGREHVGETARQQDGQPLHVTVQERFVNQQAEDIVVTVPDGRRDVQSHQYNWPSNVLFVTGERENVAAWAVANGYDITHDGIEVTDGSRAFLQLVWASAFTVGTNAGGRWFENGGEDADDVNPFSER